MPTLRAFRRDSPPSAKPNPAFEFLPEVPEKRGLFGWRRRDSYETYDEPRRGRLYTAVAVGIGLIVGLSVSGVPYLVNVSRGVATGTASVVVKESTVTLTSVPAGAAVYVDGTQMGQTPLSLNVAVGAHVIELRSGTLSRRMPITAEAGKILSQHVDFGAGPATGGLQITSDPVGAQVSIDGTLRGVTPLNVPELAPGAHRVTVSSGRTSVQRTVEVSAGATATLLVSVPVAAPTGFVTISAPIDLDIFEGERHLGSGRMSRISLPAGRHTLELVNRQLSFRTESTVTVVGGRVVDVNVPMPNGTLFISALPWADVLVDGRAVGQTPIGNLAVSLGPHEITWRHPEHGERRQTVLVNGAEPVRLGIDWTR
jgi:hypothetical protein